MNNKEIYNLWIEAWHNNIELVDKIADDNCIVHQSRIDEKD